MSARAEYRFWRTASDGRWRFALVAANHEPLGPSQGYASRAGVLRGIEAHRRNAQSALVVEVDQAPSSRKPSAQKR